MRPRRHDLALDLFVGARSRWAIVLVVGAIVPAVVIVVEVIVAVSVVEVVLVLVVARILVVTVSLGLLRLLIRLVEHEACATREADEAKHSDDARGRARTLRHWGRRYGLRRRCCRGRRSSEAGARSVAVVGSNGSLAGVAPLLGAVRGRPLREPASCARLRRPAGVVERLTRRLGGAVARARTKARRRLIVAWRPHRGPWHRARGRRRTASPLVLLLRLIRV